MSSIDEKRVYEPGNDAETAYVASEIGVVTVSLVGERVGDVSLRSFDRAYDVAARSGPVVVATERDVFEFAGENGENERDNREGEHASELGYGPANAVDIDAHGRLFAGGENGIACLDRAHRADQADRTASGERSGTENEWQSLGSTDEVGTVRAIDGGLIASDAGVFRIRESGVEYVGLDTARDVRGDGVSYAATTKGLYALANGPIRAIAGNCSVVTADRTARSSGDEASGRAHAVCGDDLYERADGEWRRLEHPAEEPIVDIAYGTRIGAKARTEAQTEARAATRTETEAGTGAETAARSKAGVRTDPEPGGGIYAVTRDGRLLADVGDSWREFPLGSGETSAIAIGGRS